MIETLNRYLYVAVTDGMSQDPIPGENSLKPRQTPQFPSVSSHRSCRVLQISAAMVVNPGMRVLLA